MRRAVLALFLVSLAAEAQFRESIEVRLVELDVVVTDRQGNRVHGLKPEDFEVYDTRTLQKITNFTEYGPAAPTGVAPAASAGGSSDAPRQPQNFLLLIDTLPRTFLVRAQTFAKIARLLDKLMTNGDRVSLVKWDRGFDRAEPLLSTNDRAEVMRTLRKIAGVEANAGHAEIAAAQSDVEKQFLNGIDARSMINVDAQFESSGYFSGELTRMSFQRKMRAMKQLVQSLAAGPGRKTVLYVANGFSIATRGPEHLTGLAAIEDVVRAANAGRVTFYAVTPVINDDPEAMDTRMGEANALQNLTLPTGGTYDFGVGGVEKVATSIAEDASAYYSIAYQTRSDGRDRARNVSVRTKNRAYRVRTREVYVQKSKETVARETVLARLYGAATEPDALDPLVLNGVVRVPSTQLELDDEGFALVRILIASSDALGNRAPILERDVRIAPGEDGFVAYTLPPRTSARVAVGVLDRRSGRVGVTVRGAR